MQNPALLLVLIAAGGWIAWQWQADRAAARGTAAEADGAAATKPGAFPGATDAPARAIVIAIAGALALLALETAGEFAFGIAREQSRMTWLFAAYSVLSAPVIEELVFRGWIVVAHRGRALLWTSVVAASALFALLHPFLWRWDDAGFALTLTTKGAFSTAMLFAGSLWFYIARFAPWNPQRSLLPCFAAHAAKNAGVVAVKLALGFVG